MNTKPVIDFSSPDERDVLRAIFFGADGVTPRGFTDVFSEEEIMQMWGSDALKTWSTANRDWLYQTVRCLLDKYTYDAE